MSSKKSSLLSIWLKPFFQQIFVKRFSVRRSQLEKWFFCPKSSVDLNHLGSSEFRKFRFANESTLYHFSESSSLKFSTSMRETSMEVFKAHVILFKTPMILDSRIKKGCIKIHSFSEADHTKSGYATLNVNNSLYVLTNRKHESSSSNRSVIFFSRLLLLFSLMIKRQTSRIRFAPFTLARFFRSRTVPVSGRHFHCTTARFAHAFRMKTEIGASVCICICKIEMIMSRCS